MAIINLATKYESKLDERYTQRSLTDAFCGKNFEWNGVNAISVWTLLTDELNDYDATASANRFGTPSEVDDELNTYPLKRKRSFSKVFDITNVQDQMFVKKANSYLKQMWDERYIPEIDTYRLKTWANGAGLGLVGAALTKSTVAKAILLAHAGMDDAGVPSENRVTFVRTDVAVECKLAEELNNNQNWTDKTIIKGKIAEIGGSPVVSVPKSRMPAGVEFIVKYKNATADPMKLRMLRANDNAPGYAGTLMEGLCRYDSFVLAQKADGIYVYSTAGTAAPTISQSGNTVSITGTGTIKYTTDGSNPKTSETAQVYSSEIELTKNAQIRAYAYESGKLNSAIASHEAKYGG